MKSLLPNRYRVLNYIRSHKEASRVELADELKVDRKTITNIIDILIREKYLTPVGFRSSNAGRRQELLAVNGSHSNYIGIDLGATHIIGVLVDSNIQLLDRKFFEIRPGLRVDLIVNQMKIIVRDLLSSSLKSAKVSGLGICVPGFVNPKIGLSIISENIPGWQEIDLQTIFEDEFGLSITLEDSSRSLGLAEKWLGFGGDKHDFLVIDIGYGIGMAIFVNGRLYTGSSYKSGEIGHTIVQSNGLKCACGNRGCLETVASGRAIAERAKEGVRQGKSKTLLDLAKGNVELITAQDVGLAAGLGDKFSVRVLGSAGSYLGTALANVVNVFNPYAVVIGGGLVNAGQALMEQLKKALSDGTMMGIRDGLNVIISKLGMDGSALGASILAMQPLFSYADIFLRSNGE